MVAVSIFVKLEYLRFLGTVTTTARPTNQTADWAGLRAQSVVSRLSASQHTAFTALTFHTDLYWLERSLLSTEIFTGLTDLYRLERSWVDLL